jgi:hypothetical protein
LRLASSEKHAAQRREKLRKHHSLNYKSAALPVERRARNEQRHINEFPDKRKGYWSCAKKANGAALGHNWMRVFNFEMNSY